VAIYAQLHELLPLQNPTKYLGGKRFKLCDELLANFEGILMRTGGLQRWVRNVFNDSDRGMACRRPAGFSVVLDSGTCWPAAV
jgi:hypothetical protein